MLKTSTINIKGEFNMATFAQLFAFAIFTIGTIIASLTTKNKWCLYMFYFAMMLMLLINIIHITDS